MALLSAMAKIHMNLLHLSDMHFGPRHWLGNDKKLLEKINSYDVDIVLNTGDSTTDALENEFEEAGQFLQGIDCTNVISIPGNHDKRNTLICPHWCSLALAGALVHHLHWCTAR